MTTKNHAVTFLAITGLSGAALRSATDARDRALSLWYALVATGAYSPNGGAGADSRWVCARADDDTALAVVRCARQTMSAMAIMDLLAKLPPKCAAQQELGCVDRASIAARRLHIRLSSIGVPVTPPPGDTAGIIEWVEDLIARGVE